MNLNRISTTIKDTSRSIYVQLLSGKVQDRKQLINDVIDLEIALKDLRAKISLESSGYCAKESDLKGLAQREAMR